MIGLLVPSSRRSNPARAGQDVGRPLLPRASNASYHALDGGSARRRRRRGYVSVRRSRLAVPHRLSSTQSARTGQSSERFADPPPPDTPSGDSSPPSRRGHGLASGATPETSRRLAPVPGDGDVASGDPPQVSQSPREKGTSRVARGGRRRDGSREETDAKFFRYETNTTEKVQQNEQKSARSRERGAGGARDDGATAAVGGGCENIRRADRLCSRAGERRFPKKRRTFATGTITASARRFGGRRIRRRAARRGSSGVGRSPAQSARGGGVRDASARVRTDEPKKRLVASRDHRDTERPK